MDFDILVDNLINLSGSHQINYLNNYKDYDFNKEEYFLLFSLLEEANYFEFINLFKDKLVKLGRLGYYFLVSNMSKDMEKFAKYGKCEMIDSYFDYFKSCNNLDLDEFNLYYNNLLKLSSLCIKFIDLDKINMLRNMVFNKIKVNKNISFNELSFIGINKLNDEGLINVCNKINNTILDSAYGYTNFKLYVLTKPECKILLDYNKIEKEFKDEELLFMLFYAMFHEIEHVKQVMYAMSKNNYHDDLSKKLAVSYKRGFFIESIIGHDNMNDYDNITIEYNAKLLGMIRSLSFVKDNFSDLFSDDFILNKYKEVNRIILENKSNYRNFDALFARYDEVYNTSKYKRDFDRSIVNYNYDYKMFEGENSFVDEQFMLLLMGEDNVFRRVIMKNNIGFDKVLELVMGSLNSKKR